MKVDWRVWITLVMMSIATGMLCVAYPNVRDIVIANFIVFSIFVIVDEKR